MVGYVHASRFVVIFRTSDLDLVVKIHVSIVTTVVTLELIENMSFFLHFGRRWALAHQLDLLLLSLRKRRPCYGSIGPSLATTEVRPRVLDVILTAETQVFREESGLAFVPRVKVPRLSFLQSVLLVRIIAGFYDKFILLRRLDRSSLTKENLF